SCDHRRFQTERTQVFGLEMVNTALTAGAGEDLDLRCQRMKEVCDSLGSLGNVQSRCELGILSRDAHRTTAGVAVVTRVRRGADFMVVIDEDGFVAVQRNEESGPQVTRIGAQGERFGAIRTVSQTTGDNKLHGAVEADVLQGCARLTNCRQGGNTGMFLQE